MFTHYKGNLTGLFKITEEAIQFMRGLREKAATRSLVLSVHDEYSASYAAALWHQSAPRSRYRKLVSIVSDDRQLNALMHISKNSAPKDIWVTEPMVNASLSLVPLYCHFTTIVREMNRKNERVHPTPEPSEEEAFLLSKATHVSVIPMFRPEAEVPYAFKIQIENGDHLVAPITLDLPFTVNVRYVNPYGSFHPTHSEFKMRERGVYLERLELLRPFGIDVSSPTVRFTNLVGIARNADRRMANIPTLHQKDLENDSRFVGDFGLAASLDFTVDTENGVVNVTELVTTDELNVTVLGFKYTFK